MPTDIARYSIEIFKQGGEGIEQTLARHADINFAGQSTERVSTNILVGLSCFATALGYSPAATARTSGEWVCPPHAAL